MGFASGLATGLHAGSQWVDIYNQAKLRDELAQAASLQPDQYAQYTPDQVQRIEAAANAGGLQWDAGRGGYLTGAGELLAPGGHVHELAGQTQATPFTPDQVADVQRAAMAQAYARAGQPMAADQTIMRGLEIRGAQRQEQHAQHADMTRQEQERILQQGRKIFDSLTGGDHGTQLGALQQISHAHNANDNFAGTSKSTVFADPRNGRPTIAYYPGGGASGPPVVKPFTPDMAGPLVRDWALSQMALTSPQDLSAAHARDAQNRQFGLWDRQLDQGDAKLGLEERQGNDRMKLEREKIAMMERVRKRVEAGDAKLAYITDPITKARTPVLYNLRTKQMERLPDGLSFDGGTGDAMTSIQALATSKLLEGLKDGTLAPENAGMALQKLDMGLRLLRGGTAGAGLFAPIPEGKGHGGGMQSGARTSKWAWATDNELRKRAGSDPDAAEALRQRLETTALEDAAAVYSDAYPMAGRMSGSDTAGGGMGGMGGGHSGH